MTIIRVKRGLRTSGGSVTSKILTDNLSIADAVTSTVGDQYAFRAPSGSDKYIDPSAASDGSGSFASPYKTISSAKYAGLAAGQALWVRAGSVNWPDCTNAQNGTQANRVVLSGYPGEAATIVFTDALQRVGGADWHQWRNVDIQCQNIGLCLANYFTLSETISRYFEMVDCTGTRNSRTVTDNSALVSAYGNDSNLMSANGAPISFIRCQFFGPAGATQNESLILLDRVAYFQVIGCLVDRTANPIYFKHNYGGTVSTQYGLVKNCIIRRAGRGFQAASDFVDFINNAFDASVLGLDEDGGDVSDAGGNSCNLRHNTFLNSDIGFAITSGGSITHLNNVGLNNVFLGSSRWADNPFSGNSSLNQNNVIDYSAGDSSDHWYRNGSTYSRSQYHAAFSSQETNGVQGTCALVGGTTPGGTPSNWALNGGSVGIGNASDGGDRGVNAANLLTVN